MKPASAAKVALVRFSVRYHLPMRSFSMRGMTMIDVLVGAGLVLVVFVGLFGLLRASLQVSGLAKLKAAATEVATSQLEYIRSLEYEDIGTVGGIPAGLIEQNATTTNAGMEFSVRTYIVYVDDPADGVGGADTTGITTDYKLAKVTVTYEAGNIPRDVVVMSNIAPKGIETTTGGGTIRVSVVDAVGAPVSGASVHIENPSASPAIDFTTFSDVTGTVLLPGAPTSTDYRIEVTKSGYSTATTYARNATNANPTPGYLTVVGGSTTSGTFAIDRLATLTIRTFSPIAAFVYFDSMATDDGFSSLTNTNVVGSALTLTGAPGSYQSQGSAVSDPIAPEYLASWTSASSSMATPPSTSVRIAVGNEDGVLLPDAVVPGNSTGFTGTIDLSSVSTTTYPSLTLVATLESSDPNVAPQILDFEVGYDAGPLPLPNVAFDLTGAKTIGSMSDGTPLYKTEVASTTGASGAYVGELEWDSYEVDFTGYTVLSADPLLPYDLTPGSTIEGSVILTP
jgi:hypothetical protein